MCGGNINQSSLKLAFCEQFSLSSSSLSPDVHDKLFFCLLSRRDCQLVDSTAVSQGFQWPQTWGSSVHSWGGFNFAQKESAISYHTPAPPSILGRDISLMSTKSILLMGKLSCSKET